MAHVVVGQPRTLSAGSPPGRGPHRATSSPVRLRTATTSPPRYEDVL